MANSFLLKALQEAKKNPDFQDLENGALNDIVGREIKINKIGFFFKETRAKYFRFMVEGENKIFYAPYKLNSMFRMLVSEFNIEEINNELEKNPLVIVLNHAVDGRGFDVEVKEVGES